MKGKRLPRDKAAIIGADVKDPGRFKDRKKPKGTRPLGDPYVVMTEEQVFYWNQFRDEIPWLNSSHRQILKVACVLATRLDADTCGIQAIQAYSAVLSKLGATPSDETKISYDPGESEDPDDAYFQPRH